MWLGSVCEGGRPPAAPLLGRVGMVSYLVRASPGLARSFGYPPFLGAVSQAACIVGRRLLGHSLEVFDEGR